MAKPISNAPTLFGVPFGFRLTHQQSSRAVVIEIDPSPSAPVSYVYPCRFGSGVRSITADGHSIPVTGFEARLPAGITRATIEYLD
jgi:hypothetical protein